MNKNKLKKWGKKVGTFLVMFLVVFGVIYTIEKEPVKENDYKTFQEQVKAKEVVTAQIDKVKNVVLYETKDNKKFTTAYPDYPEFKKELLESGVDVTNEASSKMNSLISVMQVLFFGILFYYIYTQTRGMRGGKNLIKVIDKTNVTFADVAGYKEVKEEVQTAVDILKNGKKYSDKGASMPKGMILYGEPGTGKTLIAQAIAGEAGVPFFSTTGADFIEKFVGVGAQRVRSLFEEAKKKAPCIIFIDEIDAIGGQRSEQSNSEQVQTINALLTHLDGFSTDSGIFVIATTNRLETLDPALIRTGRFDLHVKVPLPYTAEERVEIMNVHAKGKEFAEDVNFLNLAKQWIGFSGADIKGVFNQSAIIAVTEGKDVIDLACLDEATNKKILKGHFKKGVQKDRNSDELKLVAYHEAGHAVVGKLLETGMDVSKVTILASTTGAGGVTFFSPTKMGLLTISEMESRVKVSYAGRIAELLLFGDEKLVTTGASGDIEQATANIKEMVSVYGMNKNIGMLNLDILGVDKSELFKHSVELSKRLYDETETFMRENWHLVEKVALALLEKETISEGELDVLMSEKHVELANLVVQSA
jgi:cell division protease FtsH